MAMLVSIGFFAIGSQENVIGILFTEIAQDLASPNSASDALELEIGS